MCVNEGNGDGKQWLWQRAAYHGNVGELLAHVLLENRPEGGTLRSMVVFNVQASARLEVRLGCSSDGVFNGFVALLRDGTRQSHQRRLLGCLILAIFDFDGRLPQRTMP